MLYERHRTRCLFSWPGPMRSPDTTVRRRYKNQQSRFWFRRGGGQKILPPIAAPLQVLAQPLEERVPHLSSADFARYSISASSFGSTQMPLAGDALAVGLGLSHEWLQPLAKLSRRRLVESVVEAPRRRSCSSPSTCFISTAGTSRMPAVWSARGAEEDHHAAATYS